jgi:predicted dehydrogenase
MTVRLIQVGTGGQGAAWCHRYLPPNVTDGTVEVVAAADVEEEALDNAREGLALPPERCYTDAATAMAEHDADAVALVVPPHLRESMVESAVANDLHVLAEKPLADSLAAAHRIVDATEDAGLKMGVTMSHRYRQDVTTLRRELRSGEYGDADYFYGRYHVNARSRGSWAGPRLYDWDEHPLLVDGSVHHLDFLADMADSPVETVFCRSWNPGYSDFEGDPNAVVQFETASGTTVVYEGVNTAAVSLNGWGNEHVRANCEDATLVLDGGELYEFPYEADAENCVDSARYDDGDPVELHEREKWSNTWLVEQFADWCAGGEPMETNARANLRSLALVFAAIESAETGEAVDFEAFLERDHTDGETD